MQPGDTLAWVAQSMGVSQYDLIAANGIANPDFIYVGQVLTNPNCGAGRLRPGRAPAEPYAETMQRRVCGDGYDCRCSMTPAMTPRSVDYPMAGSTAGEMPAQQWAQTMLQPQRRYGNEMYADYPAGDYAPAATARHAA